MLICPPSLPNVLIEDVYSSSVPQSKSNANQNSLNSYWQTTIRLLQPKSSYMDVNYDALYAHCLNWTYCLPNLILLPKWKMALSKAGTIIAGLNVPKLEGGGFPDRSIFMSAAISRQLFSIHCIASTLASSSLLSLPSGLPGAPPWACPMYCWWQLQPPPLPQRSSSSLPLSWTHCCRLKKSSIDGKQYLDYLWEPRGLSCYI